jgi:hypothetical protein
MEEEREPKNENRSKKELQEGECEIGESRSLLVSRVGPRFFVHSAEGGTALLRFRECQRIWIQWC